MAVAIVSITKCSNITKLYNPYRHVTIVTKILYNPYRHVTIVTRNNYNMQQQYANKNNSISSIQLLLQSKKKKKKKKKIPKFTSILMIAPIRNDPKEISNEKLSYLLKPKKE